MGAMISKLRDRAAARQQAGGQWAGPQQQGGAQWAAPQQAQWAGPPQQAGPQIARLRLSRVFLSPNPRNIEVFRAIADHEAFRKDIVEIVYDDARLTRPPVLPQRGTYEYEPEEAWDEEESLETTGAPFWFVQACKDNAFDLNSRRISDVDTPDHIARSKQIAAQMTYQESWNHYQHLLQQQDPILRTDEDIRALEYGLTRFPALKRITITAATHGFLYTPLYETPMIRAFPYGFNYPTPRGWPCAADGDPLPSAEDWIDEPHKNNWRGARKVLHTLAHHAHPITELVIDARYLQTGLSSRIFEQPCAEHANLVAVLGKPGFRRLDLDLLVNAQEYLGWPCFRRGLLRAALANATGLEHVTLRTNVCHDPDARATVRGSAGRIENLVPLRTVFPVEKWSCLRHFGLSNFLVVQEDVIAFLAALPTTLRTVELSFLGFLDNGGCYRTLLEGMRDTLDWRGRDEEARPRVTIGVEMVAQPCSGRGIWVDREVDEFLYRGGENMFGQRGWGGNQICYGVGTVRDAFDPAFERPWVDYETYQRLGIYKGTPRPLRKPVV
ncbi:uncharacterized protein GGS22DRAFT_184370 [Annulohypoxylon maeteangense]|uniref:uncharacterized protein n=1 Tax=Annulohypoxylon maeteangense TaxID=1927788 RepID=UPI002008BE36|nr:uncharacterized protein GGS22DRAFT_184370 [Annulohypoxylon maeteangense]KAI0888792.1 hypothetical protein GGS22DRAFT_184370 [Annulohypoxylon maeteangense]